VPGYAAFPRFVFLAKMTQIELTLEKQILSRDYYCPPEAMNVIWDLLVSAKLGIASGCRFRPLNK
jgi:hypothetical protein